MVAAQIPPPPPALGSPANGAEIQDDHVDFRWANATGATAYRVHVIRENYTDPVINEVRTTGDLFAGPTALLRVGNRYTWKVRSINGSVEGNFSGSRGFTVVGPPPPLLLSPPHNSLQVLPLTLQWTNASSTNATQYRWRVTDANTNQEKINETQTPPPSNVTLPTNRLPPGPYRWSVRSQHGYGEGRNFSEPRTFTIGTTPPPVGPPPADAAIKISGTVRSQDGPIAGATVKSLNSTYAGATTDSLGHYEFYVNPGTHIVEAKAKGFAPQKQTVGVSQDVNVNFTLEKARVILVIIDGLGSEALATYLNDSGLTPTNSALKRLATEGVFVKNVATVFPSYTAAAHASILTGAYPGTHGIVGNEVMGEAGGRLTYRRYIPDSYNGSNEEILRTLGFGEPAFVNAIQKDISAQTLYSAVKPNPSLTVGEPIREGATEKIPGDFPFASASEWDAAKKSVQQRRVDEAVVGRFLGSLREKTSANAPVFSALWFANYDLKQHESNTRINSTELPNIDQRLQEILDSSYFRSYASSTTLLITADHGMSQTFRSNPFINLSFGLEPKYPTIVERAPTVSFSGGRGGGGQPIRERVDVVVAPNGRMAHLYVVGWRNPGLAPITVANYLRDESPVKDQIEEIFVRTLTGPPLAVKGNISGLTKERVDKLFQGPQGGRAGDIAVTARPGFQFHDGREFHHGSLTREDSLVPLIASGPGIKKHGFIDGEGSRTVDISDVVVSVLGLPESLPQQNEPGNTLASILEGP